MPGIKTSRIFYSRGISKENKFFGFAVQSNYPIVQPPNLYNNTYTKNKTLSTLLFK